MLRRAARCLCMGRHRSSTCSVSPCLLLMCCHACSHVPVLHTSPPHFRGPVACASSHRCVAPAAVCAVPKKQNGLGGESLATLRALLRLLQWLVCALGLHPVSESQCVSGAAGTSASPGVRVFLKTNGHPGRPVACCQRVMVQISGTAS